VLHAAHQGAGDLVIEDLLLRHESNKTSALARRVADENEVEVPDVIAGEDDWTRRRDVLGAEGPDPPAHRLKQREGSTDDGTVDVFQGLKKLTETSFAFTP
jgi:hypothetical protein